MNTKSGNAKKMNSKVKSKGGRFELSLSNAEIEIIKTAIKAKGINRSEFFRKILFSPTKISASHKIPPMIECIVKTLEKLTGEKPEIIQEDLFFQGRKLEDFIDEELENYLEIKGIDPQKYFDTLDQIMK